MTPGDIYLDGKRIGNLAFAGGITWPSVAASGLVLRIEPGDATAQTIADASIALSAAYRAQGYTFVQFSKHDGAIIARVRTEKWETENAGRDE